MKAAAKLRIPSQLNPEDDFVRYALDSAAIVATTDVRGTITYVNSKFCEISGYSEAELIGSNHRMLKSGEHGMEFFRAMYREIARGRVWHGEICNRRKDGSRYWVDTTIVPHTSARGKIDSYTSIRFDITARKLLEDELRASKEHLRRIANIDPLTDLPNRRRFQEYITSLVAEHAHSGREFHLALLDVDTFKEINDSFGHPAGDAFLQTVASRLRSVADERMLIFRLGGDEFGLIFVEGTSEEANALFEHALEAIRQPTQIAGTSRRCSASLGVANFPGHGRDLDSLLTAADLALYHAKSLGRDRVEVFQPRLKEVAERKSEVLAEIEQGLQLNAFELHYQPIVPVASDRNMSLEALMRWRHPQRGLLTPAVFQEGFSDPAVRATLGQFMLERVFRDVGQLRKKGVPLNRVAINLTNSDFRSDSFLDRFFELSNETGVGPQCFCVEVTEGMFLGLNQKRVEEGLHRLHDAGVEVALDDFGTGYASLTHLRQLPIDRLKIDRSFVANMVTSKEDQAIARGIIEIAHSLGKAVTAEGVETLEQVELLSQMNCDLLQGWYFGKACEVERLVDVLEAMPPIRQRLVKAGTTTEASRNPQWPPAWLGSWLQLPWHHGRSA
ncbi:putative bifunctional diguanylate cyclase/phosphodiesterase [Hyphomicrobium sp.]|uniref:putative bifunctional diguanylate cyclase/phosphodiesterase n=1 Tax=Hyphomicrobium sp. TaxID=82 RepID=UPI002E35E07B|nr:EAL domain-containing protein [Hyphomicrobium sp.]HEX2840461.1 EAL domain-containing protein [Hyphomicrobium sp.]